MKIGSIIIFALTVATGAARFVEVPEMGHTFQHYLSMADAFADKSASFDSKHLRLVADWLKQQLKNR